jgi:Spy/CpxP family protein refolding chaperone
MTVTKIKALGAALVLSAAFAAPALARDAGTLWPQSHRRAHHEGNFRDAHNGPLRSLQAGDMSRVGGWRDPSCFNGGNGN